MAIAAEVQIGTGEVWGLQGAGTVLAAAASLIGNIQNTKKSEEWKEVELPSQDGATIASIISSQRRRKLSLKIVPNGATRAAALAIINNLNALAPNAIITLAAFSDAILNGTWNYKGGGSLEYTPEGYAVVDIMIEQYQQAADGSFSSLAVVAG